jgi:molybdate transport system ATP-binding protein
MLRAEVAGEIGSIALDAKLEACAGSCVALAGPSGAGKTSILRVCAGLLRPARGYVECGDACWLDTSRGIDVPAEARRVGYVFQDYALFEHLRVWQNVGYAIRRESRARRRGAAIKLLERFGIAHLADSHPRTLSGGERQRVALARALASSPRALLLDEPLSALDVTTRRSAARELAEVIRALEVPVLLVTHDFGEAALLGERVAILDTGRIVQAGAAAELAARPANAFVADFTGAVVLTGTAVNAPHGGGLVELDGGGTVAAVEAAAGRVAVSVFPWEISIEPAGTAPTGSARNRLPALIESITQLGPRVRLGLVAGQPLAAEVTETSVRRLGLAVGDRVTASWKATATRVVEA